MAPPAPADPAPVLLDVESRIATITLNRPAARNALTTQMRSLLPELMTQTEADDDVDVVILTGADPAFCAGLDLDELANIDEQGRSAALADVLSDTRQSHRERGPFPRMTKPLIGAVNGAAITGGLELALNCDFLIASEHARFGDTHTRVGVMPGWGLTVLLPEAIGIRRAREMSFTGNFVDAGEALDCGLVNHVVPHDELIPFTRKLAADIAGNDRLAVRQIRATYRAVTYNDDAWETEARDSRAWKRNTFSPFRVAERRAAIIDRGSSQ